MNHPVHSYYHETIPSVLLFRKKKSDISISISCLYHFSGVGVNLRPLNNTVISVGVNFLSEKLNFLMCEYLPSGMLHVSIWLDF